MAEAENLTDYTIETRAERINTRVYDDALRQGETDKVISKGSFSETVVGAETTTVGGHLTELYNDQVTSTLTTKTNTYEGPLTLTGTGDSTIMGGVSIDTQAGGIFIGAVMSDDLIAGGGVRLSAPCDMWLAGLVGMEEKIVTGVADGAFLDISSIYFEREFVTSNYAIGTATLTGTLHATTKAGFKALFKVNQGVRNLAPGGGGGGGGAPSAPVLPPAAAEGAASAGGMAQSAARAGTSIEDSSDLRMLATRLDDAEIVTDLPAGGATTSLTQRQPLLELATSLEDGTARLDDAAGSTPAAVLELDEGAEGAQLFDNWARGNADDAADFQARFDDANWQDLFSGDQVDFAHPERVASDEVKNFDFKEAFSKIKAKELKYRRGDNSVWTEWQSYMALHNASSDAAGTARDFVANVTPGPGLNGAWDSAADYEDFVSGLSGLPVDDLRGKLASQVDAARASQDYDKLVLLQNSLDALDAKIDDIFSTATTKAADLEGSGFRRLSETIDPDALTEVLTIEHDKLLKQFNDASDAAASGDGGLDGVLTLTQRMVSLEAAQKAVAGGLDPIAVINNDLLALRLSPVAATDPNLMASITAFQDLSAQLESITSRSYIQKLQAVDLNDIAQFDNLVGSSPYASIDDLNAGAASSSGSSSPYASIDDLSSAGAASSSGSSSPYASIDDLSSAGAASSSGSSSPYASIDDLSADFDDVASTTSRSSDAASGAGKAATDGGTNADPPLYATIQRAPSPEVPQRPEGLWESTFSKLDDSVPTGSLGEPDFDEATRLDLEPRQLDVSDIDSRPPAPLPEEDVYALADTDSAFDADDLLKIDDDPVYAELRTPGRRDRTVHDPKPYHLSMDDVRQFKAELPQLRADAAADAAANARASLPLPVQDELVQDVLYDVGAETARRTNKRGRAPLPDEAGIIDNHYDQLQRIDPQGRRQPRASATPDGYATLGDDSHYDQLQRIDPQGRRQPRASATPDGYATLGDDIANPGVRSGSDIDARAPLALPDESGIIDSRLTPPNFEDPDDTYTKVPDQLQRINPQGRRQPRMPAFNVPATPDGYATVVDDISNPGVRSGSDIDARAPLALPDESGIIDSRLTPPNFEDPDDTYTKVPDQLQRINPQGRRQPRMPAFNVPATPDGYATVVDDISNPGVRSGADVNARAPLPDEAGIVDSRLTPPNFEDPDDTYTKVPDQLQRINPQGRRQPRMPAFNVPATPDGYATVVDDISNPGVRSGSDIDARAPLADEAGIVDSRLTPPNFEDPDDTYTKVPDQPQRIKRGRRQPRMPAFNVPATPDGYATVIDDISNPGVRSGADVNARAPLPLAAEDSYSSIDDLSNIDSRAQQGGWADLPGPSVNTGGARWQGADAASISPYDSFDFDDAASTTSRRSGDTTPSASKADAGANAEPASLLSDDYTYSTIRRTTPREPPPEVPVWDPDLSAVLNVNAEDVTDADSLAVKQTTDALAHEDNIITIRNLDSTETAAKVPDGLESGFISRGWASDADYLEDAAAKGYAKKAAADLQSGIDPRPGLDAGIDTLRATEGVDNTANIDLLKNMKGEYTEALSSHTRKTAVKVPDGLESGFISRGWASDADYLEDAAAKGYAKKAAADLQSGLDPRPGLDAGIDTLRATEGVDNTANIDLLKSMKGEYTDALSSHTRKTTAKVPDGLESSFISRGWASDADYLEDAAAKGYAKKAAADLQSGIDPRPGLDAGIDTLRATEGVDNTTNIDLLKSMKGEYTEALNRHTRKLEQADQLLAQAPLPSAAFQAEEAAPRKGILSIPDVETASDFHDSHDLTKIDNRAVPLKKKKSVSFSDQAVTIYTDGRTYDQTAVGVDDVSHAKRREPLPHNRLEHLFDSALRGKGVWANEALAKTEEASDNIIIVQNIVNSKGIIEEQSTPAIHISIVNRLENARKHTKLNFAERWRAKNLINHLQYYQKTGKVKMRDEAYFWGAGRRDVFHKFMKGEAYKAGALADYFRREQMLWNPSLPVYGLSAKQIDEAFEALPPLTPALGSPRIRWL